jgi:hypothetical protein
MVRRNVNGQPRRGCEVVGGQFISACGVGPSETRVWLEIAISATRSCL